MVLTNKVYAACLQARYMLYMHVSYMHVCLHMVHARARAHGVHVHAHAHVHVHVHVQDVACM